MSLGSPAMRTAFSPVPIDGMGFSPSPVANNLAFGAPTFLPVLPVLENPVPVPQPVPAPVPQQLPPTPPMPAQMPPMLAPPTFLITPPGLAEGGIGVQPTNSYGYGVPAPLPPAPPLSAPFQQPPTLPHSLGSPNQRPSPNTLPAALPATNPHYVLINGRPTAVDGSWATEQLGQFHPQLGMNVPAPFGVADPAIYGGDGAFEPGVYVEPAPSILPTRIFSGSSRWVRCLTVDVEGTVLFAGGDDAKIRLWDLMTGQRQRTLKGHGQPVYSLVQDPGTGTVFSGALDGALLAHDPRVSRPVASYKVHTDALKSLVLKKDGTRLYSAGYDGRLAEWWEPSASEDENWRRLGFLTSLSLMSVLFFLTPLCFPLASLVGASAHQGPTLPNPAPPPPPFAHLAPLPRPRPLRPARLPRRLFQSHQMYPFTLWKHNVASKSRH